MELWIILVIVYGILNGFWDIFKKKALQINSLPEVLCGVILIAFLLVTYEIGPALQINIKVILMILFKTFIVFSSWLISFYCIKKMPLSVYAVINLSRILFYTLWGIIFFNEIIKVNQIIGAIIIVLGIVLINIKKDELGKKTEPKYIFLLLGFAILSSLAGLFDKIIMSKIASGEHQFWYMLFMSILAVAYLLTNKKRLSIKTYTQNYWIILAALALIIGDRFLFLANGDTASKLSVMSLLKQTSVIVTVISGGLIFKEKNILFRFVCAMIVLLGIGIVVMF